MSLLQLHVEPGQEVVEILTQKLADAGVRNGAVVSLIGAIDSCCITNMPADDASVDTPTEYSQPLELSGTGEIVDGRLHLHVTISGESEVTRHGHLRWARVGIWYVAAYVIAT